MPPSRPRHLTKRRAFVAATGVCLLAISDGSAQEAASPLRPATVSSAASGQSAEPVRSATAGLRPSASVDHADDMRRTSGIGPSRTLAPAPRRSIFDGPPAPDAARDGRIGYRDGQASDDDGPSRAETVDEPFDLLDDADRPNGSRPSGPDNLATAPAMAAGVLPDPGSATTGAAADRKAGRGADLLIDAQRRNISSLDLAVPASAVSTRTVDGLGGRINLPVTGLRPSVPLTRDDPFAPVGTRVGSFVLYSTLDQSAGASTNLSRTPRGASGGFSETELSARLLSDWSLHAAELNGLVSYRRNFEGILESDPKLSLDGRLRLDIDRLTTATITGAVRYRREDPIERSPFDEASDRPDILTYSAAAKLERSLGRLRLGAEGSTLRETTARDDAPGLSLLDENYTTTTARLRIGYDLSPAIRPFVAGSVGRRIFDESRNVAGLERDSLIEGLRGGVAFDLGEKFLGEFAAGYAWNVPDADGLKTTASPTFDARIAWSPRRGTDFVLSTVTSFQPDTLTASTSTLYESGLALRHRMTARTDLTGAVSVAYKDSEQPLERQTTYAAEAGFVHWLNRSLAVTGLVRHERLDAEREGGDYDANSIRIGLRVQR